MLAVPRHKAANAANAEHKGQENGQFANRNLMQQVTIIQKGIMVIGRFKWRVWNSTTDQLSMSLLEFNEIHAELGPVVRHQTPTNG